MQRCICTTAHALSSAVPMSRNLACALQAMLDDSAETPSIEQLVDGSVATVAQMPAAAFSLADMLVSLCGQDSGKNKQQVFKGLVHHLTRHGSAQVDPSFPHACTLHPLHNHQCAVTSTTSRIPLRSVHSCYRCITSQCTWRLNWHHTNRMCMLLPLLKDMFQSFQQKYVVHACADQHHGFTGCCEAAETRNHIGSCPPVGNPVD